MNMTTDAQERKAIPVYSGFVKYFPLAMAAVAELSRIGNDQHNPGKPLHWDRSKSGDELDACMRHLLEAGTTDIDGIRHSVKAAWRAMANAEKELEAAKAQVEFNEYFTEASDEAEEQWAEMNKYVEPPEAEAPQDMFDRLLEEAGKELAKKADEEVMNVPKDTPENATDKAITDYYNDRNLYGPIVILSGTELDMFLNSQENNT